MRLRICQLVFSVRGRNFYQTASPEEAKKQLIKTPLTLALSEAALRIF